MKKEELYDLIADLAYYITEDTDFRNRIAKAIAMIAEDVEEWRKECRNKERFVR